MPVRRIPSLDGLRAISVSLVLLYHISLTVSLKNVFLLGSLADQGWFGVQVFFVLSGFLITHLLLEEEVKNGRFSLSGFYTRRAFRILPPALFYLFVVFCLREVGKAQSSNLELTASALFFRNLIPVGSTETSHYWTLSIEEQFYLVWPFLLLLIRNNRVRLMLVAGLLCFAPVWRHIALVLAGGADKVNYARMDLRYDPLLIGCLLAFVRFDPALLAMIRKRIIQNPLVIAGALAFLWLDLTGRLPKATHTFSYTLQGLCLALTISYFIDRPTGVVGRVLDWKPILWMGTPSYSLYLWNQLFLKPYPEFNF